MPRGWRGSGSGWRRSVERWRRQWREHGQAGVRSKGSPGRPRLDEAQVARLEQELERGPLAHGWADQRWTLARVKTLIGRLFRVGYTVEGTWRLLKRHGWSWQQLARRAIERDDEASQSLRPPRARTWGRIGHTPVVQVRGRGSGRVGDGRNDLLQERRAFPADLQLPRASWTQG
ncbi:winged helix-turn-helix domain-containing protein [Streptomyces sp. NPDC059605]|uniref:winged helix-turn-helix domain-containing protein n=1 Tax=unclassified Streptomyces TaxID=2593676 RepID=UPI003699751A